MQASKIPFVWVWLQGTENGKNQRNVDTVGPVEKTKQEVVSRLWPLYYAHNRKLTHTPHKPL